MAKNEKTGKSVGSLAGKVLSNGGKATPAQVKKLAASALTQRPDHKPSSKKR